VLADDTAPTPAPPRFAGQWWAALGLLVAALAGGVATLVALALGFRVAGSLINTLVDTTFASNPTVAIALCWSTAAAIVVIVVLVSLRAKRRSGTSMSSRSELNDASRSEARELERREERRRSALSDSWWVIPVELLIYATTAAAVLWPAVLHPMNTYAGTSLDPPYYVWLGWRLGDLMRHGAAFPTTIPDALHPVGANVLLLDGVGTAYISGWWNLVAGPFLAYNLTLLTAIALNLWCGRMLGQACSARRDVWVVSALAFATAPVLAGRYSVVLSLAFAFPLALLARDAILIARRRRPVNPLLLAALLVVAYLCSVYFLVFGALVWAIIVGATRIDRESWRSVLGRSALGAALAVLVLAPFVVARAQYASDEHRSEPNYVAEARTFSADGLAFVTPPDVLRVDVPFPDIDTGNPLLRWTPVFPGWILFAAIGGLLVVRGRLRIALVGALLFTTVLAWGPSLRFDGKYVAKLDGVPLDWLPYRALLAVPLLGGMRVPERAGLAVLVVLVALGAFALDRLLTHAAALATGLVLAVCAVLLVGNLIGPVQRHDYGFAPGVIRALEGVEKRGADSKQPDAVLVVPADCNRADPQIDLLQSVHHRPILGCNVSAAATPWSELDSWAKSEALAAFRCEQDHIDRLPTAFDGNAMLTPENLTQLRDELGVRFLVVNDDAAAYCPTVAAAVAALDGYEVVGSGGPTRVIDLDHRN